MNPIRVVVADDHPLFRQGVLYTLSRAPGIEVVGEAASGAQALAVALRVHPDVILLDITMPDGDGLSTAAQIKRLAPAVRIVMLTASEERDDLLTAMKAGVDGYVVKGAGAGEVVAAVEAAAHGEWYVTPRLAGVLLHEMTRTRQHNPLDDLSEREREVLRLIAEGRTNKEIGRELHLAEKTVKHYVTAVLQKLNLRSRVEAALWAQRYLNDRPDADQT